MFFNVKHLKNVTKNRNLSTIQTMSTFGKRLHQRRTEVRISGWYIEKLTGYSRHSISNIEKGRLRPSDEAIEKLASVPELGVDIQTLKSWRAIDDYGPEAISEAVAALELTPEEKLEVVKRLFPKKEDLVRFINESQPNG